MQREEETLRVFSFSKKFVVCNTERLAVRKGTEGKRQIIPMIVYTGSTLKQPQ